MNQRHADPSHHCHENSSLGKVDNVGKSRHDKINATRIPQLLWDYQNLDNIQLVVFTTHKKRPKTLLLFYSQTEHPFLSPHRASYNAVALVTYHLHVNPRQAKPSGREIFRCPSVSLVLTQFLFISHDPDECSCFDGLHRKERFSTSIASRPCSGVRRSSTCPSWEGHPSCRPSRPARCTRGAGPRPAS